MSDYGIGRYRGLFWTQALAGAVACLALAVALGAVGAVPGTQSAPAATSRKSGWSRGMVGRSVASLSLMTGLAGLEGAVRPDSR